MTTPSLRRDLRRIVIIASSSRGGSSLFAELLRQEPRLAHFPGEVNHCFRQVGLTWPAKDSDAADPADLTPAAAEALDRILSAECGQPLPALDSESAFAEQLTRRLAMQWVELPFDVATVRGWLRRALDTLGWNDGVFRGAPAFHAAFLGEVRARHPAVNPGYYDLDGDLIRRWCPDTPPPQGPPNGHVVEEPPFVTVGPWRPLSADEMRTLPLVVKSPSNAYRMDLLRACFPHAEMRVVHLTRNPAAAVNGLYDGWLHHGFFSHALDLELSVAGYSDRFPSWGTRWWKFDLPPGWRAWTRHDLAQVCAFQWAAAHQAVLQDLAAHPQMPVLRLRFEDVVASKERRREVFQRLAEFLGLPSLDVSLEPLQPVMATRDPRPGRWRDRADVLAPALDRADVRQMAEWLGYGSDARSWD